MLSGLDQVGFAREVIAPAPRSTPMSPSCSPTHRPRFTHQPTPSYLRQRPRSFSPDRPGLARCSNDGQPHPAAPISRQHLLYYLDEFIFRFNRPISRARLLFYRCCSARIDSHPLSESSATGTLDELTTTSNCTQTDMQDIHSP